MPSDTLVLSIFKDEKPLKGANGLVDWRLCGRISKLIMDKSVTGRYKETTLVLSSENKRIPKILIVGLGKAENFNENKLNDIAHFIAKTLKNVNAKKISLAIPGSSYFPQNYAKSAEIMITAFADSYEKKGNLLEMVIFETGRRIQMVCEGAKHAKALLKNDLLLTLDV
jgi:leucyl aminopeptidase